MRTDNITVYYYDKAHFPKQFDGSPERSFSTPWVFRDGRLFRIDLTIIRPIEEESENYVPFCDREAKAMLQTIADLVKSLSKKGG